VESAIAKAKVLIEALPYIKQLQKKIIVVKYGGSILQEDAVRQSVLTDIAFLRYAGIRPVLVHGGGPHINERLKAINHPVKFINGLRYTDRTTLDIVVDEMDILNGQLVREINVHGAIARGFVGSTCLLKAERMQGEVDLGFVGRPTGCDDEALKKAMTSTIPVLAPMGVDAENAFLNINADDIGYFLASHLKAEKLVFFTKELGIMRDVNDPATLISTIRVSEAEKLIADGTITGGMVPKVRAAAKSIHDGVNKVHIVDAKIPHALLLEIFTDEGIGTQIIH
jgi:acetylglutamate kinase